VIVLNERKYELIKMGICLRTMIACSVLVWAGCVQSNKNTPTSGISSDSANAKSATPSTTGLETKEGLLKATKAQMDSASYRAKIVSSTSAGTESTTTIEFVAPDRYRMTREADASGKPMPSQQTIIVGKSTYMKMGNAEWQKFPIDMGEMISQFRNSKLLDELAKNTEVKVLGPDVLDGTPTIVYQYTLNDVIGKGLKSSTKAWVSVSTGLPQQTETEGDITMMGKTMHTKTIVTYSSYGADIQIEAPK
jgi:outer membrane lipoprotein-sorting protein